MMIPEGRKYNMFSQGFIPRLSVLAAVILISIGSNTPSNTPRISAPATIERKQCHKLVPVMIAANNVEDTMSIIVWTPNGSDSSLANIARTPIIKDNNTALEELKCRLKS